MNWRRSQQQGERNLSSVSALSSHRLNAVHEVSLGSPWLIILTSSQLFKEYAMLSIKDLKAIHYSFVKVNVDGK